jgi:hypothetical protein
MLLTSAGLGVCRTVLPCEHHQQVLPAWAAAGECVGGTDRTKNCAQLKPAYQLLAAAAAAAMCQW